MPKKKTAAPVAEARKTPRPKATSVVTDKHALAVLCASDNTDGVNGSLRRYADLIVAATQRLEFSRTEWCYLADALNGCLDLWQYSETSVPARTLLVAEVEDSHRLNRLGDKWLNEEGGSAADRAVQSLLGKLTEADPVEVEAVLLAIRHFWDHPEIDASVEDWWTIGHRLRMAQRTPKE